MSRPPDPGQALDRGFRFAYPAGLALCVLWPLVLQVLLGTVIHRIPGPPPGAAVQQLGYTFTGLTLACALGITWRWGRLRASFRKVPIQRQGLVLVREIVL